MKKLLLLISISIITVQAFSQTDPLRQKLDSIFQHVDKAQISTGYLKEYGAELMPIHCFNGVLTDSNTIADIDCFRTTYTDIATAKIQSQLPLMKDITLVNNSIDSLKNISTASTPVAILYGSYASLRDDALSLNLFTVSNQQIYDVAGRSQSPYVTKTLFAAASINKVFTDTVSFTYKPVLYYTNTNVTLTDIAVDFKDGQGFHLIPVNGKVTKTYTDSSSRKIIDFRGHLSTGAYVYCHSSVDVFVTTSGVGNRYAGGDPYSREVPVPVVAGEGLGGDVMQIRYGINNPTRTNVIPHLRKPLIYVEGYDVSGKYNILNLINEWDNVFISGQEFDYYLDDIAGYDLVFVNYNTLRSFEDNSKMLQHVIEWVKQDKTAGGYTAQNVIIGTSAGGVLARYTLARMTKTISSASTDTRLLITHDSPHQGANVPLAFQHFLYDLGNVKILGNKLKDNLEDLKNFYVLNTQPATAQLLRARVIDENGTVSINTFLNGPGSPYQLMIKFGSTGNQPIYRFIATAQGSQCGVPVMPSNALPLADYDGDFAIARFKDVFAPLPYTTKYFLTTQLNALPSAGAVSQIEYFKYSRRISFWGIGFGTKILKEVPRNNPVGFTEWDAAPGSTESINDRTGGALNTGLTKQKLPFYVTPFVKLRAGLNVNVTQDLFSFVSTTSALDAPPGTPLNMVYLFQNTGTNGTSSQKYIAQERFTLGPASFYNQNHTDFTARNSRWIYNEMETITQPIDCNDYCDVSSLQLNGPSSFCTTSGLYTINNLPPNATVTWSSSPNLVQFSCNPCSQTALTKTSNGIITLSANIVSSCGNTTLTKSNIKVGTPTPSIVILGIAPYPNTQMDVQVNTSEYGPYKWYVDNVLVKTTYQKQSTISQGACGSHNLKVEVSNSCGTASATTSYYRSCSMFIVSPNPVTDNVTVAVDQQKNATTLKTGSVLIYQIKVIDAMGIVKKQFSYSGVSNATINLSELQHGMYTIQISDGSTWSSTKVIKEK